MSRCGLLLLFVLVLSACATGRSDPSLLPSDAGPASDAQGLAEFGSRCALPSECSSGLCIDGAEASPGWCTSLCSEGCPASYACGLRDEAEVCVPASEFLCGQCESDADCGAEGNRCLRYEGGLFCGADCANATSSCPDGFSCQPVSDRESSLGLLCVSNSGFCCVDADGDFRGEGDDCRATDCDETDPEIYDDALEVCDGKDNDCTGGIDLEVSDCAAADCRLSSSGYVMRSAQNCQDAECVEQADVACGLYACTDGDDEGDACAISCDGEDELKCGPGAHCDDSTCLADQEDGLQCDEASDCSGEHCQNRFCCEIGDCCQVASDCPAAGTFTPVCESPRTCQGARGAAVCTEAFTCATTGVQQDDSACDSETEANNCGFYRSVFCSGDIDQTTPTCPTSCSTNTDCDDDAYCDGGTDTCLPDLGNGQACQVNAECQDGHCQNGFCCQDGDCCQSAVDCPLSYSTDAVCTVASACQGQQDVAVCVASECGTLNNSPNDSACDSGTVADTCGPYLSLICTGAIGQDEPSCATSCTQSSQCDTDAYCNAQGQCEFDEVNGSVCNADSQCSSGHCENGFCCATGDCCASQGDCSHLDIAPSCDSPESCQGARTDGVCNPNFQCTTQQADDDSACAGLPTQDCGPYPGVSCSNAQNQSTDQLSLCSTSCVLESDCDPSTSCQNGECIPDTGQGGFCTDQSDCGGTLVCVDSVCCATACSGDCQSCDLVGSIGTCATVPLGQDPDAECSSIDCNGFYFGWQDDTCYQKASLTDAAATCGGDGSCGSTVEECSAQPLRGVAQLSCDTTCQTPNLSSCTGTTAGTCNDVDLGSQSCGQGVCQASAERCIAGLPQVCTPNTAAATNEICDGIDNDCNGIVDDGITGDSYEANNSCASNFFLGTLEEGQSSTYSDMTLYSSGDEDWYRQLTTEGSTACTEGIDETYRYTVDMTPTVGQDYDLQLCYNSFDDATCTVDCFGSDNGGDQSEHVSVTWQGPCGGTTNDGLNFFIRVYPYSGASSCQPYSLQTLFEKTN